MQRTQDIYAETVALCHRYPLLFIVGSQCDEWKNNRQKKTDGESLQQSRRDDTSFVLIVVLLLSIWQFILIRVIESPCGLAAQNFMRWTTGESSVCR